MPGWVAGWAARFRRVPTIPQLEAVECGAASLAMILAFWGRHAGLPEVRIACQVSRDGANAAQILEAARGYGLEAEAVKVDVQELGLLPLPAIIHWDFEHFVVLERVTEKGIRIVDPAVGRRFISLVEAGSHFTGVALVFAPLDTFERQARRFPSLSRYLALLRELWPSLVQLLGASLLLQVAGLVFPMANQVLVDRVVLPKYHPWLWGLALGLGLAAVARLTLTVLRSYLVQGLQNRMDRQLMGGFVAHLAKLPLGFFLQRQAGDLVNRVESNTQVRDLFSSRSVTALLDVFLLVGYAGLMLAYDGGLALLVWSLAGLRVLLLLLLRDRNEQLMAAELAVGGKEESLLVEALEGIETVKASGAQEHLLSRWAPRLLRRMNVGIQRRKLGIASAQFMALLQGLSVAFVLWVGGREVLAERMSMGVFTAFLMLQNLFLVPLESLLEAFTQTQFLRSHLFRLDDVFETPVEATGSVDPGRLKGEIVLSGVGFRYGESAPWILRGVSLHIRPGEKVALVGPSGAGKSTLSRLLMGMLLPTEGTLTLDGHDLRDLDLTAFRRQLGVVLQESFLFDDTVRANLSLRDPDTALEQLQWAAERAQVHEVIRRLPEGYETRVGENARTLSGGERQRLCLARALVGQPSLLLLDEATSSLDLATEARVHANLAELGCTRILIAHRLETVKDADRILVIQDGGIRQQGTYGELAAVPGAFRDAVLAQEGNRA